MLDGSLFLGEGGGGGGRSWMGFLILGGLIPHLSHLLLHPPATGRLIVATPFNDLFTRVGIAMSHTPFDGRIQAATRTNLRLWFNKSTQCLISQPMLLVISLSVVFLQLPSSCPCTRLGTTYTSSSGNKLLKHPKGYTVHSKNTSLIGQ